MDTPILFNGVDDMKLVRSIEKETARKASSGRFESWSGYGKRKERAVKKRLHSVPCTDDPCGLERVRQKLFDEPLKG
jgi:hypothetical protein